MNATIPRSRRLARRVALVSVASLALLACGSDEASTDTVDTVTSVSDTVTDATDVTDVTDPADAVVSSDAQSPVTSAPDASEPVGSSSDADATPPDDGQPAKYADATVDDFPDECREVLQTQVDVVVAALGDVDLSRPAREIQAEFSEPPAGFQEAADEYDSLECNSIPTDVEDEVGKALFQEQSSDLADVLFPTTDYENCDESLAVATGALDDAATALDLPFSEYSDASTAYVAASSVCDPAQITPELDAFYAEG